MKTLHRYISWDVKDIPDTEQLQYIVREFEKEEKIPYFYTVYNTGGDNHAVVISEKSDLSHDEVETIYEELDSLVTFEIKYGDIGIIQEALRKLVQDGTEEEYDKEVLISAQNLMNSLVEEFGDLI